MDNRTYWEKRAEIREAKAYSNCLEATNGLVNAYRQTAANIRREVNDFYNRFADENGLTYADAVKYLNREEELEWQTTVEGYIEEIRREKDPAVRERLMREYDARAYGARITRLESLNASIDAELSKLYARANEQFRELLGENFAEGYYRTIFDIQSRYGYSSMFAAVNSDIVENALTYPWSGANFSDRLWKHKGELLNTLRETLTSGLIRGDSVQNVAKRLAERLKASQYNALRLIRTESSHIHNTAELEAYKACGFEEYEFMASLGERTCEVCGDMDGRRIKLADKKFGVNFPPLHPNCRCTTIAYDPDDDLEDMKSGELDYEQWYQKYVEGREQPRIEGREGVEIELPANEPVPVMSGGNANTAVQTLTTGGGSGIITTRRFDPLPQEKVVNILRQESDDWINQLTDEELRAVRKYTKNSGDTSRPFFYERLNSMLRGAIPEDGRLRYYADTISSALKKNTLKHDILCYRRDCTDIFAGLSEGDEFLIHSFFSTSATPKGALNKGILCKIHVPAGTDGAYIEQLSSFPNQREFLLDKRQKYRVLSRKDNIIELEVVINEQ